MPEFKSNSIKSTNLSVLEWNIPVELSIEQILSNLQITGVLSGHESRTVSNSEKVIVDKAFNFLAKLCDGTPSKFITDADMKLKARLVGAWINVNFDQEAMVYVADKSRAMRPYLERAWDRIGSWLA